MMNNVNYQNLNTQNLNPELRKRLDENQENYTALDKEQLKNDAVQIATKAKENLQENFAFRFLRKIGVKNPKKFTSFALTIATIVGLAFAGNKLSAPSARLGEKLDDILLDNSNIFGKTYGVLSGFFTNAKRGIGKQLSKIPVVADIKDTMQNRKLDMQTNFFRGYERGPVNIFIMTLNDLMERTVFGSRKSDVSSICSSLGIKTDGVSPAIPDILTQAQAKLAALKEPKEIDAYKKILDEATLKLNAIDAEDVVKFDMIKKLVGDVNAQKFFDGFANGRKSNEERKFFSEFINVIVENLQNNYPQLQNKTKAEILTLAKNNKLVDFGGPDVSEFIGVRMAKPAQTLAQRITKLGNGIKNAVINLPKTAVNTVLHPLLTAEKVAGALGSGFQSVVSEWWPVTTIEDIGRKIPGNQNWEFCRGNLFDSLIKYDAMNGTGAKTLPGKIVQKAPTLFTEGITNFVNDKSGFGVFLCFNLLGLFDRIQEAPKDKKASTIVENFANQNVSWMLQNPLTYSIIYNTATLKNLQGTGIGSKLLRIPGKIFGLGLGPDAGVISKILGGGMRFMLFQQIILPKVSRTIDKITKKIFKPYDPEAEAKQRAIDEQRNKIIPELGITQGELLDKMQKNPQALQQLQNNPELLKMMDANPKLLVDYLDGKDITKIPQANNPQTSAQNSARPFSPSLVNRINQNRQKNSNINPQQPQIPQGYPQAPQTQNLPQGNNQNSNNVNNNPARIPDSATYIPSSEFIAGNASSLSEEQSTRYNKAMDAADKALKRAEKFI